MSTQNPTLFDSLFDDDEQPAKPVIPTPKKKKKETPKPSIDEAAVPLALFDMDETPSLFDITNEVSTREEAISENEKSDFESIKSENETAVIEEEDVDSTSEEIQENTIDENPANDLISSNDESIATNTEEQEATNSIKPFVIEFEESGINKNDISIAVTNVADDNVEEEETGLVANVILTEDELVSLSPSNEEDAIQENEIAAQESIISEQTDESVEEQNLSEAGSSIDIASSSPSFVSILEAAQQQEAADENPVNNDFVIEIKSDANVEKSTHDQVSNVPIPTDQTNAPTKEKTENEALDLLMRSEMPYQFPATSIPPNPSSPEEAAAKTSRIIFENEVDAITNEEIDTTIETKVEPPEKNIPLPAVSDEKILLEDWNLDKNYYSISAVAKLFSVNISHIRFWTNEFNLKPRTNKKGDRLYTPENIKTLQLIHHLVKVQHHTIKGAKEKLKNRKEAVAAGRGLKEYLEQLKATLVDLRSQIQ